MTLRVSMLDASRASGAMLGDAYQSVVDFYYSQHNDDGGFRGRNPKSDIYYSAFGIGGLLTLDAPLPDGLADYLRHFGDGSELDFVHLACLARCWANLADDPPTADRRGMTERLLTYRAADGGFAQEQGAEHGSAYGCFLGLGALEDLGCDAVDPVAVVRNLDRLRTPDGGYANEVGQSVGVTTLTSGVLALQRHFGTPIDHPAGEWLLGRLHPLGGFQASPQVPIPDLLSTATAMQALNFVECECNEEEIRNRCLHFLDTVWDEERGAFCGHAFDKKVDCEYTWYGLLALGHLVDPEDDPAKADGDA